MLQVRLTDSNKDSLRLSKKDDQEVADVEMENAADSEKNIQTKSKHDDYIELMGHNVEEVKGGKLLDKKSNKKRNDLFIEL